MSEVPLAASYSLAALETWALAVARACSTFFLALSTLELNSVDFRLYSYCSLTSRNCLELGVLRAPWRRASKSGSGRPRWS